MFKDREEYKFYSRMLKEKYRDFYEDIDKIYFDYVERIGDLFGMNIMGYGGNRVVLDLGDKVVKLALYDKAKKSIKQEIALYDLVQTKFTELLKHIPKVYEYGEYYIIEDKCLRNSEVEIEDDECDIIYEDFKNVGIEFIDIDDSFQFGKLDNKVVLIDFEKYIYTVGASERNKKD